MKVKDYSDRCRPGACLKVPSNIPFQKTKQRALYGADLAVRCEVCNKSRVVYIENRPTSEEIKDAKAALKNVRYVCGGRVSSFGRSLAVIEEVAREKMIVSDIEDEIENETMGDTDQNTVVELSDENEEPGEPVNRRKKKMIIESDDSEVDDVIAMLSSPEQSMVTPVLGLDESEFDNFEKDSDHYQQSTSNPSCSFCGKFETGHKCKLCHLPCCNICNTIDVDELADIVCPNCPQNHKVFENYEPFKEESEKRGRGRPRKKVSTGATLMTLVKKRRGRPSKQSVEPGADVEASTSLKNNENTENVHDEIEDENNNEGVDLIGFPLVVGVNGNYKLIL